MTSPSPDNIIDVAIIGGGVSGAYTAYRLMQDDAKESPVIQKLLAGKDKLDVRLIEMGNRIGGRLWSIDLPGLPDFPVEMGGVSFSRFQHNVYGLCTQKLGLETKPSRLHTRSHLQYVRDHHFWPEDYKPQVDPKHLRDDYYPSVVPFFFQENDKFQYPGKLLARLFNEVNGFEHAMFIANSMIYDLSIKDPEFVDTINSIVNAMTKGLRQAELCDQPLYEHGLWNVVANLLSPDACNLIQASTPSRSFYSNHNLYNYSVDSMREEIFARSYHALTEGYDKLPKTLVKNFKQAGGTLHMQTRLLSLNSEQYNEEQLIKLSLGSSTKELRADLYARYVVLALPQRALKLLSDDSNNIFGNNELDLLDTVTAYPAQRLNLVYDKAWWQQIKHPGRFGEAPTPITDGFSVTDLPLNTCYYVGQENRQEGLLLALLDDTIEGFWSHLRPGAGPNSLLNPESYIDSNSKMVIEAQRQIEQLHQIDEDSPIDIPDPTAGLFWDWMDEPFGGGWHLWNPGVKSWEVAKKIRQPNSNANVFVCGEAYSEQQGWVEGALNSAEMMLEEHFELPRPNWVPDCYEFGS